MDAIMDIANQYGLKVIEDSCEALGAEYKGKQAGMLGDMGVFAFYPNKQITTGEGGMIVTDDEELATRIRKLSDHGSNVKYQHDFEGLNSRLDELQAAMLRVKLARLPVTLDERRRLREDRDEGAQCGTEVLGQRRERDPLHEQTALAEPRARLVHPGRGQAHEEHVRPDLRGALGGLPSHRGDLPGGPAARLSCALWLG